MTEQTPTRIADIRPGDDVEIDGRGLHLWRYRETSTPLGLMPMPWDVVGRVLIIAIKPDPPQPPEHYGSVSHMARDIFKRDRPTTAYVFFVSVDGCFEGQLRETQ